MQETQQNAEQGLAKSLGNIRDILYPLCQELFKNFLIQYNQLVRNLPRPWTHWSCAISRGSAFLSFRRTHSLSVTFIRHPNPEGRRLSFLIQALSSERGLILSHPELFRSYVRKKTLSPDTLYFKEQNRPDHTWINE